MQCISDNRKSAEMSMGTRKCKPDIDRYVQSDDVTDIDFTNFRKYLFATKKDMNAGLK